MTFSEFLNSEFSKEPHYLLIGNPINHSVSPLMHNTALQHHKIAARYIAVNVEVSDFEKLSSHINRDEFLGANITIPHKQNLIQFVDTLSRTAESIGAINTLVKHKQKIIGDNTDGYGFKKPLLSHVDELERDRAIVFGSGGATKAIVYALNDLGFKEVFIVSRKPKLIEDNSDFIVCSYDDWQHYAGEVSLFVNATPLGMTPNIDTSPISENDTEYLTGTVCYDIVYNPRVTKFLQQAKRVDGITVQGLEMLIHQGDEAFFKWTGKRFPIDLVKMKLDEHFSL